MIAFALASLFSIAAVIAAITLTDSALRGRNAFAMLQRERSLVKAGFIPQVEARQLRLRRPSTGYRGSATRAFARRLPRPAIQQLQDVAAA